MGLIELLHTSVPSPTVVDVGGFAVRWYGLLLALAALVGYLVVRQEWRERKLPIIELERLAGYLVLAGLAGARFADVFVFEWWYFRSHLGEAFALWRGGLAFHGGLVAGVVVLWLWARRRGQAWLALVDTFAPAAALGQAVGRWGNYFNQELFGLPTSLPWGIPIVSAFRPAQFLAETHFHPVFLYEFLGLIAIAFVLWRLRRRALPAGTRFALYLVLASVLRFALELLRVDEQVVVAGVRAGMWVALGALAAGSWLWWRVSRRSHPAQR